jgi:hypothetical protein
MPVIMPEMPQDPGTHVLQVAASSAGRDPHNFTAGGDLVLQVATEHGVELPEGVGLDDHLDADARGLVDSTARTRFERWRQRRRGVLTVDGLDLTSIWEIELVARCFQPGARIEVGLTRAIEASGAGALSIGPDVGPAAGLLRAVAARVSAGVVAPEEPPGAGVEERTAAPPLPARLSSAAGVPALLRGQVLCVPYWNVTPVYRELAARTNGARPAASGVVLPGLGARDALRAALRGGWLGHPGAIARRRAEARAARVIAAARQELAKGDDFDEQLDRWALGVLGDRAASTLAASQHTRRALGGGAVRSLLVPFDGTPDAALLVDEARRARIPSVLVQHGFDARMGAPDKARADVVALWSDEDRSGVPAEARGRIVVTGNPGAEHLIGRDRRAPRRDRTLVLVDYPSRMSALISERVGQRHVAVALEGLARARPGTTAIVRPHPSEQHAGAYLRAPAGLRVELDMDTQIEAALGQVDLCIGAMSTATLQAAALGVPVVYLEVAGHRRPWPLDGSVLPTARDAEGLAQAVSDTVADPEVAGQASLIEALGVHQGATAAVCALLDELVAAGQ